MKLRYLLLIPVLALSGCIGVPQWRVGQAEVPKPLAKNEKLIESERQAADLLARRMVTLNRYVASVPHYSTIVKEMSELSDVSVSLSNSLGTPTVPIKDGPKASVVAVEGIRKGIAEQQKQAGKLNKTLAKYAGKEIEDTGINLFGGSVVLSVGAFIAAIIFIPGFGTFILFAYRRMRKTVGQIAAGVEAHTVEDPAAGAALKEWLSAELDKSSKAIVAQEKKYIDRSNIDEVLQAKALETKHDA